MVSLNSIMVDATGMCGPCLVPIRAGDGTLLGRHACIDCPEFDAHAINRDTYLPRFGLFKTHEQATRARHGLA